MNASKDPIELCEEAAFLLRNASALTWASYFIGTMPFVLGLLYFWSDMTRGNPTNQGLILEALELSALFIWMKSWQAIFAGRLRDKLTGRAHFRVSPRWVMQIVIQQARWQPWGLLALPVAAVLTIPFGWTFAYFQNLTALGADEPERLHTNAFAQARLWPMQNHWLLLTLFGLFFVVFLNVLILLILLPQALITLFGVKELFHPSFWLALNTTFLALVFALTHLIVDPFAKAVYVVRCFYGQSISTGEDLRVRLEQVSAGTKPSIQPFATGGRRPALQRWGDAAILFLCLASQSLAAAPEISRTSEKLDAQIENVLKQPEYSWKLPRELEPNEHRGPIAAFFDNLARLIGRAIKAFFQWIEDVIEWLLKVFRRNDNRSSGSGWSLGDPRMLLYIILALTAAVLLVLLWKSQMEKRARRAAVVAVAVPGMPDLRDEEVSADALPEDEWFRLANQLLAEGDLRLAIRALFLGALADLARREIVSLAKFKSNRDYERELRRRSAAIPERAKSFAHLVGAYERIWYQLVQEPSSELFSECENTVRLLRSC